MISRNAVVAAGLAVGLLGACGGSTSTSSGTDGGAAAAGSGGSAASGTGGSGASAAGGSSASGGTAAQGGSGGSSVICPGMMPPDGAPCAELGATCSYPSPDPCCPDTLVTCIMGRWQVESPICGAPPPARCPDTPPTDGSACASSDPCGPIYGACSYGICPSTGSPAIEAVCNGRIWQVLQYPCDVDAGPVDCSAERRAVVDYAAAHKACNTDSDCTAAYALCAEVADFCDGTVYVNQTTDPTEWKDRNYAYYDCLSRAGVGCALCDGIAPPPVCRGGVCQGL